MLFGETFLAGFLNVIPRSIWPEKWLGGGPNLKNMIHPGSYDLSGSNITSYTTGLIVENFMNFQYLSILIGTFMVGTILFLLKVFLLRINDNIILFVLYLYITFSFTFTLMFGEFLGIYSRTLIVTFPFIMFFIFTKKIKGFL